MPSVPGPTSFAQVWLAVPSLFAVAMVELSWSHWPLYREDEVPSVESTDSHRLSYHSGRSRPHLLVVHQATPSLSLRYP